MKSVGAVANMIPVDQPCPLIYPRSYTGTGVQERPTGSRQRTTVREAQTCQYLSETMLSCIMRSMEPDSPCCLSRREACALQWPSGNEPRGIPLSNSRHTIV